MTNLPEAIFRRWGHSFEEDHENVSVYRPADYPFPRARGRPGIEFRRDGTYVDWTIGPADVKQAREGRWVAESPGRVRVVGPARGGAARVLEILRSDDDVLELRERPTGT
jgi:hypothetical protein